MVVRDTEQVDDDSDRLRIHYPVHLGDKVLDEVHVVADPGPANVDSDGNEVLREICLGERPLLPPTADVGLGGARVVDNQEDDVHYYNDIAALDVYDHFDAEEDHVEGGHAGEARVDEAILNVENGAKDVQMTFEFEDSCLDAVSDHSGPYEGDRYDVVGYLWELFGCNKPQLQDVANVDDELDVQLDLTDEENDEEPVRVGFQGEFLAELGVSGPYYA